jgi:hypothetical protein
MISSCCTAEAFSVWNSTVQLVSMELTGCGAAGAMIAAAYAGCCLCRLLLLLLLLLCAC